MKRLHIVLIGAGACVIGIAVYKALKRHMTDTSEDPGISVSHDANTGLESNTERLDGYYVYPAEEELAKTQNEDGSQYVRTEENFIKVDYKKVDVDTLKKLHETFTAAQERIASVDKACYIVTDGIEFSQLAFDLKVNPIGMLYFSQDKTLVFDDMVYEKIVHPEEIFKDCWLEFVNKVEESSDDELFVYSKNDEKLYCIEINRDLPWATFSEYSYQGNTVM